MLLPIADIFTDEEVDRLSAEVKELEAGLVALQQQTAAEEEACRFLSKKLCELKIKNPRSEAELNTKLKEVADENHNLEVLRREAASVQSGIVSQREQQAQLDALSARIDSSCLQLEDKVHEIAAAQSCSRQDLEVWAAAQQACDKTASEADFKEKNLQRDGTDLQRELQTASITASEAFKTAQLKCDAVKNAEIQFKGSVAALNAARSQAAVRQRRLDETRCAVAERQIELEDLKVGVEQAEQNLRKSEMEARSARDEFEMERAAGKALERAAMHAERRCVREEGRARIAEQAAQKAQQSQNEAEVDLYRTRTDGARSEAKAGEAQAAATQAAAALADAMQQHLELQQAINVQENEENDAAERLAAFVILAAPNGAIKKEGVQLDQQAKGLRAKRDRIEKAKETTTALYSKHRAEISQAKAQAAALNTRVEGLKVHLLNHQENLYRVQFKLFSARRAAAASTAAAGNPQLQGAAALRALKIELQREIGEADMAQKAVSQHVRGAEAAVGQVAAATDQAERSLQQLTHEHKRHLTALQHEMDGIHVAEQLQGDSQLAVDRAALVVARAQERLITKGKQALAAPHAAEKEAFEYELQTEQLKQHLKELIADNLTASKALQASRNALAVRSTAVATAEAALRTLESKARAPLQSQTPAIDTQILQRQSRESGAVSGVCAALQRQVDELQSALAAAEADCDVIERALQAQKRAAETARHTEKYSGWVDVVSRQQKLKNEVQQLEVDQRAAAASAGQAGSSKALPSIS